jgi:hypothetical protein
MDILSRARSRMRVNDNDKTVISHTWSRISAGYGHIRSDGRVEFALEMPSAIGIVAGAQNRR